VATAPVARLGTVGDSGSVDLVPVVFAMVGDDTLVTAVDHKPKRTRRLRRLANVDARPAVTVLVDHYDDDWDALWWVRLRGEASVHDDHDDGRAALVAKYPQYVGRPPAGPFVVVAVTGWRGWAAIG
jgi:PPOX class probable F420-dependent enzyme